jgi:hypothetical protein
LNGRWKLYDEGSSLRGQRYFRAGQLFDLVKDPYEESPIMAGRDTRESAEARAMAQAYLDRHPVPNRLRSNKE